jgi:hypothetical protein
MAPGPTPDRSRSQEREYPATSAPKAQPTRGRGSMSFSRRVLHMDPLPLARVQAHSPTRRDTRFHPFTSPGRPRPVHLMILTCAPHVPVPTVMRGQQRSLVSSFAVYPQASIRAGQGLDRRPIFQAGGSTMVTSVIGG